jgi:ubiquitin-conjugating enzyme E2 D/E/ubiquitin-conjugating enzyme E2 H
MDSKVIREKRIRRDISQIRAAGYILTDEQGNTDFEKCDTFIVSISGPKDSAYEGYEFKLIFTLTEHFPFKSPSVGFRTRIFHPNVDEASGSICLDSLNKTWSPAFSLENVITSQISYLMQYPNPADPFNRDAAVMMQTEPDKFRLYAKQHCEKYAKKL